MATSNPVHGRAAGTNGQELGLDNEMRMLECIAQNGWIREHELHLLTGMSPYTIGQVGRRLAKKGQISRKRVDGNAGHFLRLLAAGADRIGEKSGKDVDVPVSWPHHAMAVQTLHFLAGELQCGFETEASMRRGGISGKIPDGRLVSDKTYHFEQERSRKSGPYLRHQTENIVKLAKAGTICYIAYPYPPKFCDGIDHETRQANSIRSLWTEKEASNIRFVRCHFDSRVEYRNMKVSRFEIIDLPSPKGEDTPARQECKTVSIEQGLSWHFEDLHNHGQPAQIKAVLQYKGEAVFEGYFIEDRTGDAQHLLKSGDSIDADAWSCDVSFIDFQLEERKRIEQEVAGDIRMAQLQLAHEEKLRAESSS